MGFKESLKNFGENVGAAFSNKDLSSDLTGEPRREDQRTKQEDEALFHKDSKIQTIGQYIDVGGSRPRADATAENITSIQKHIEAPAVRASTDYITGLNIDNRRLNQEQAGRLPEFTKNVINPVASRAVKTLDKWTDKIIGVKQLKNLGKKAYGHAENLSRRIFDVQKVESEAEEKARIGREMETMNQQLAEIKNRQQQKRDHDTRNALHEYAYGITADEADRIKNVEALTEPNAEMIKSTKKAKEELAAKAKVKEEEAKLKLEKETKAAKETAEAKTEAYKKSRVVSIRAQAESQWKGRNSKLDIQAAGAINTYKPFTNPDKNKKLVEALEDGALTLDQGREVIRALEVILLKLGSGPDSKSKSPKLKELKRQFESQYPQEKLNELEEAADELKIAA